MQVFGRTLTTCPTGNFLATTPLATQTEVAERRSAGIKAQSEAVFAPTYSRNVMSRRGFQSSLSSYFYPIYPLRLLLQALVVLYFTRMDTVVISWM
jgi:hypothetical protein